MHSTVVLQRIRIRNQRYDNRLDDSQLRVVSEYPEYRLCVKLKNGEKTVDVLCII